MPKVSVYLPDELHQGARERGLKLSALTQSAVQMALSDDANAPWIDAQRRRRPREVSDFDTATLLDDVRDGFGA